MKRFIFVAVFSGLAACEAPPLSGPLVPPLPPADHDTCNASPHANLIGQDATALEQVLLLRQVRVTRPGQAVTTDYRSNRISFHIDENNKIASIRCG